MDYLPPSDEHNPYAAPESSMKSDRLPSPFYGEYGITEPNPNARVRFSAIGDAWELFKAKMSTWLIIMLVYLVSTMGIGFASNLVATIARMGLGIPEQPQQAGDWVGFVMVVIVQQVLTQSLTALLVVGLFRTAIKQVRGLPIEVSDLFSAGDVWWTAIVATFLVTLATVLGLFIFLIGALYISARLMFTIPLVADGRLKATEAMGMSWRALEGQVLMAFVFSFVVAIVSASGALACCVGVLFTMPLASLSYAVLYRDFFLSPSVEAGGSPWITKQPDIAPEF